MIARVTLGLRGEERLSVGARVAAGTWLPQVTFLPRGARLVLVALLAVGRLLAAGARQVAGAVIVQKHRKARVLLSALCLPCWRRC